MRFFTSLAAGVAALASIVAAQTANGPLFFTSTPPSVTPGESVTLTYQASSINSPVTILLREGPSNDLTTVATLTTTATGGSFTWKVPSDLPDASDYAFQISQGSDTNYGGPFILSGSTATATPSVSVTGSSSASASASSSVSASSSGSASSGSVTSSASLTLSTSASTKNSTASTTGSITTSASTKASTTASHSSASSTVSTTGGAPTGAAANLKSPMALVFGAVAAMAYLH